MNTNRRLPVYLVIDCSESMAGPAFEAVQNGLQIMRHELQGDPNALETVWLSVITFSHRAKVVLPLTDICQFQIPRLVLGSGTSLGIALDLLEQRMAAEIAVHSAQCKGDWKPIVFLMTDGDPTDTWFRAADHFRNDISGKKANVIAVACGPNIDLVNLKRITPTVLAFRNPREPSFKEFFKWISQSVRTASVRVVSGKQENIDLPDLPEGMELAVEGLQVPAHQFVFLLNRCQRTKGLYISRFERIPSEVLEELRTTKGLDIPRNQEFFFGTASHPLEEFDMEGAQTALKLSVSSNSLVAPPPCCYCGNKFWAPCGHCGRIFCISGPGGAECPWCEDRRGYGRTESAFEVSRTLG
jgi:uncharacterized protein YegL